MIKHDQNGSGNALLFSLIVVSILLISSIGFGLWAFTERQDYKVNSDEKVAAAVKLARQDESTKKDKQFAEDLKNPFRTYSGPQQFGSLVVKYPDTWSAYVDDSGKANNPLEGYFHVSTVPPIDSENSTYALRVRVVSDDYATAVKSLDRQAKTSKITIEPYSLPQVPETIGIKATGEIRRGKNGIVVILPLRDKSIQISTEGEEFKADFNKNILPNVTFSP